MNFETIAELLVAVKDGRIDETKLHIMVDNDCTLFRLMQGDDAEDWLDIKVEESNGQYDAEKLYALLFPKATVEPA